MSPYEYFIEEGYPSEIAEEFTKYLEGYDDKDNFNILSSSNTNNNISTSMG